MITRTQKVRLGVFLVLSAALLVGTLAVVAGLQITEKRDTYRVRFNVSVSGLEPGAPVKYHGVRVGIVETVRIDREDVSQVLVTLALDAGTPVKTDTRAVMNLTGITGLKFIELVGGTAESAFVKPGEEITSSVSLIDRLTGQAEVIAAKVERLLNNMVEMTNPDNRARVARILEEAEDLIAAGARVLEENRANLHDITASLRETTQGLASTVASVEREVAATLGEFRVTAVALRKLVTSEQVAAALDEFERLARTLRSKAAGVDLGALVADLRALSNAAGRLVADLNLAVVRSREDLFGSLSYLLEGLENFSEFARIIRENPSLLLSGPREEERGQ